MPADARSLAVSSSLAPPGPVRSLFLALAVCLIAGCGSDPDTPTPAEPDAVAVTTPTSDALSPDPDMAIEEMTAEEAGEESGPLVEPDIPDDTAGGVVGGPPTWDGRYVFTEGAQQYTYTYALRLESAGPEAPDQYVGTLDVDGPQVGIRFDVLGDPTADGLDIVLTDYREGNVNRLQQPGDTLFELRWVDAGDQGDEVGDRMLMTHWREMTASGVEGTEPVQAAFYRAD